MVSQRLGAGYLHRARGNVQLDERHAVLVHVVVLDSVGLLDVQCDARGSVV